MKPKALMLSAAVLLGSTALAFAQTNSQTPQAPAGPTMTQPGTTQNMNDNAPAGSKSTMGSSATQSDNNAQPSSNEMKQAQSEPAKTSKHRVMASRRHEPRATEREDRATEALNLLEQKGYRDFSSFRAAGRDYEITTNQNGKSETVMVNPATKRVRTQG